MASCTISGGISLHFLATLLGNEVEEARSLWRTVIDNNMESQERVAASSHMLADEDVGQSAGETSTNPKGAQSPDQRQSRQETDGWELQQPGENPLQLAFQDSNLSPALSLLPLTSGVEHNFSEYSLFQQSDTEFAPLRAYPDVSMASERFHFPPQDCTTYPSECGSLSQYPLAQATILSEEGAVSCCSLSQHSLSPGSQGKDQMDHPPLTATTDDGQRLQSIEGKRSRENDSEALANRTVKLVGEAAEDETFFLRKDIPAQHLLKLLQKEVGMQSITSSAVSSASETSVNTASSRVECKSPKVSKRITDQSTGKREGPPGEASLPQKTMQPDRDSSPDQSGAPSSEAGNITMGSRSTQPDDSSEALHRELLSEVERLSNLEAGSKNKPPPGQSVTPALKEVSVGKPNVVQANLGGVPWTGPFSAGVEHIQREQDLWSSGNQTGIDGSYLGFLPQSQSTPGVFTAPPKSSVKAKLGQLSAIESNKENSYQSSTAAASQPAVPLADTCLPETASQCQAEAPQTSAEVHSLPSLNYMEKVDAWRANQSSGKTPLFDSLTPKGFSGMSPKKKTFGTTSDTLDLILTQHSRSVHQSPVSGAANQNIASGSSSSRRGEAVGSAPSDKGNRGSAAPPCASSFGRSQSHSSLSTVVMSISKHQQTDMPLEEEENKSQEGAPHHPSTTAKPSPVANLSHFSDVSLDQDLTLSSSQDSYSGIQVGPSFGASSVVSLELDNYAPYWPSKQSSPPPFSRPRELNIDERIPLYLRNLGIDQSLSAILTPFAPRGPIREPEFSPTDLCTIKGSTGTPTKSTQPSEGGSPHKGNFSRSSILSADSSISVPFSLDSLSPAVPFPVQPRVRASPSDTEATQTVGVAPSSQPGEGAHSSILQPIQQQQDRGPDINQLTDRCGSDALFVMKARRAERNSESSLQSSHSVEQCAEDSFVSTKTLLEIRKVLSHAGNLVSTGSSAESHLLSDEDLFHSLPTKTSRLHEPSVPSPSTAGDPRNHSSLLWSSSDSVLTSEKLRQSSVGRESRTSSWQPNYPSTQALVTAPAAVTSKIQEENTADRAIVLSKSARRTEPEGCSAAPLDKVPTQLPVVKPSPAASTQQLTSTSADRGGLPEEGEKLTLGDPAQSRTSSAIFEDTDQGVMSDGSSESSLAVRVAKLLQSESPSTMVSSTPSLTDQEETKAREWIKLKISGQQCEPLELDTEDRRRIEEIKKELLLRNPIKSQGSTDTECSAASIVRVHSQHDPPQSVEACSALSDANTQRGVSVNHPVAITQLQDALHPDLEARVCEIAAREGVTLPSKKPQALTVITDATCRCSASASPSTSSAPPLIPASEPFHLTELSTGTIRPTVAKTQTLSSLLDGEERAALTLTPTREPPSVYEPSNIFRSSNRKEEQKSQDTGGGQCEEPPPPLQGSDKEDTIIKTDSSESVSHHETLSVQTRSVSGVGPGPYQASGPSTVGSPARTGHVSHVHVTQSPKSTDDTGTSAVHSQLLRKDFVSLRDSSSAASSPDEGVGSSSPPEWHDTRGHVRRRAPERSDTSTMFKTTVPLGKTTVTTTQAVTSHHRSYVSPRPFMAQTPVPVLLPYKPCGSEELFYVPQREAISSTEASDTTMESSHTGSDDAVPPRFSSEVLGHQDPGLDRGVAFRHTEGIYSKRLKTPTFKMQEPVHRDSSAAAERDSTAASQTPELSQAPSLSNRKVSMRDQGTSPVQFPSKEQTEPSWERFQPVHVEVVQTSVLHTRGERDQERTSLPQPTPQQSSGTLDQLWQKFCDQWTVEESRPTVERETSLLERLERLSRLIHNTRSAQEEDYHPEQKLVRTPRRKERKKAYERSAVTDPEDPTQTRLWAEDTVNDVSVSLSSSSSQSQHLPPADKDQSENLSSVSMSTVDTARLIRAFGAHKVQSLKSSSSLSKLYDTIGKQKEERERWRGRNKDPPHIPTADTPATDESVSPDSASSASTYSLPSHHGPSRTLAAKKAVKLVNKSIQAGDFEIVRNGTRRHTRDVGITFPSPGGTGRFGQISSSSSSTMRGREGWGGGAPKSQGILKQGKNKKSPSKPFPEGVSWFISADGLKSEARKENRPEQPSARRPDSAWFEPYSRAGPWREPLRQRQVHEERSKQSTFKHQAEPDPDHRTKTLSSARVSLQEALEMRRPEFISQSRQRMRRLALQVEQRKLQAVFSQERGVPFNLSEGPARLPKPAGTALLRRAVPKKEMIQRSKQIYENLPEVQRKREEERRKAAYRSYRLNAQLYNTRIRNRVLGRRSAWQ
ncbi:uncharacterized protein alms1 [Leuresthes tenuis]|uniref:uncharacterized protein alms1 n=1 Tax=Leuresthes tenuis TaxID=355514 RepID=UPI003B51218C